MHAYLIIAHNQFELLNKLLRCLDYEENDIFIHIDKKSGEINKKVLLAGVSKSNVYFTKRHNVVWGHYSQIESELELFSDAVSHGKYEYLHLISGVDFPLKNQKEIHEFFKNNNGKEFLHFQSEFFPEEDLEKVQCYFPLQKWIGNKKKDSSKLYLIQRAMVNLQKKIGYNRNKKTRFYKGANWVSITGDLANSLIHNKNQILKQYKYSMCADEIFLHTFVMNSEFKERIFDSSMNNKYSACMRLIDWDRGGPYIFKKEDFDELIESGMLFARKFDFEKYPEIIELLEREVRA